MGVAERTAAAQSTIRQPKVKLVVDWSDPLLDASITTAATDENRASQNEHVMDDTITVPYKWAHCDGTTTLSNNLHPMPFSAVEVNQYQVGWWGATACDGSGNFATPYPSFTLTFSQRSISTLRVVGDDQYNEYPVDFVVTVYDASSSVLLTANVTSNTDLEWTYDASGSNITTATKMTLTVSKWSTANRVVKITEFYNQVISAYEGDDIVSVSLLEESEVKKGSLPQGNISANEIDVELQNVTDLYFPDNDNSPLASFVKPNRKMTLYFGWVIADGSTEYEAVGTFWSGDWDVPELGTTAKVTARDRMELLRQRTYVPNSVFTDVTFGDLLETVLDAAKEDMPDLSYSIDSELYGSTFSADYVVLERESYFKTLQKICQACISFCYMSRDDVLTVVGPTAANAEEASYYEITKDMYTSLDQPASGDQLYNVVEVTTSPLVLADSATQVYLSNAAVELAAGESKTVSVKYSLDNTDKAVLEGSASLLKEDTDDPADYASIQSATYYSWGAEITVYTATAENVRVKIDGKLLSVGGQETVDAREEASITDYGERVYKLKDNDLVQTRELAELIAETLVDVYHFLRKDVTVDWFGDTALSIGDDFRIPTYQKNGVDNRAVCKAVKNKVDYSNGGGFRMTTTGKKLSEGPYVSPHVYYQDTDGVATKYQDTDGAAVQWQDGDAS